MKSKILSLFTAVSLSLSFSQFTNAKDENIEVTPIQEITQQELAAIHVLSEICPSLVKDQNKFETGFNKLVKDYMPNEQDPNSALQSLVAQAKFKPILQEAQADAKKAGDKKNKAICEDVSTYSN